MKPDFILRILIVEDNDTMREGMVHTLEKMGHSVEASPSPEDAAVLIDQNPPQVVITDYKMAGMSGMDLLKQIKSGHPAVEVILVTAYGSIELAIEAMKHGAWDFITKPFSADELRIKMGKLAAILADRKTSEQLAQENRYYRRREYERYNDGEIVGGSRAMETVHRLIRKVAPGDTSVIIQGESGTGKELVARAIHLNSPRKNHPFIRVNCGALAEGILESELFGHEKGAFTGAVKQKKGRFELADRGTLFLDEIGDISPAMQIKLLRVLQEKEFERVGGETTLAVDVRIIAATHRNLMEEVEAGRFREDLYYRLFILPIHIPPLRERKEDIPGLAAHFIERLGSDLGKKPPSLTRDALALLRAYDWPGNVRELENILERAMVLTESDRIDAGDLAFLSSVNGGMKIAETSLNLENAVSGLEKRLILRALEASGGVKARAARLLSIPESVLYYKLKKYDIPDR